MNPLALDNSDDRKIGKILRMQADAVPDSIFLMADAITYSFSEANTKTNRYVAGFLKLNLKSCDRVVIFMESCPEFVLATIAVNKIGAVWVPVNTDYKGEWLKQAFTDSRAAILLTDAKGLLRVLELGCQLPFDHVVIHGDFEDSALKSMTSSVTSLSEFDNMAEVEPNDSNLHYGDTTSILWTSGTTGSPKGVMQSHNVWITGAQSVADIMGVRSGDIAYNCVPLYNSAAWVTNIYQALVSGIPCAIDPYFSVSDFWTQCRYYGATTVFTLGAMHMFLWKTPEQQDDADNPVRGAMMIPMPDEIKKPFCKRFGITDGIHQGYGQSEIMTLISRKDDGARQWKPNALGTPAAGIELKVLDDNDREVGLGEVGEFAIRPREPYAIFNGYFNNPEATLASFRNLWYHTGDLGMKDEEGNYFFVDRKADFIRYKGRNISSFSVEAVVSSHPQVKEVAAHGVQSTDLESEAELKITVVLQPDAELTEEQLARHINDNAPYFVVPSYIEFVDALPYTPSGKLQKYKLRKLGVTENTWDAKAAGFKIVR